MPVDVTKAIKADHNFKWLDIGTVKRLLADLPDDGVIAPNMVGNLAVFDANKTQLGYIDLATGQYVEFEAS